MSICEHCTNIFLENPDNVTLRSPRDLGDSNLSCPLCLYFKSHFKFAGSESNSEIKFRRHHYHPNDLVLSLWNGVADFPILELQEYPGDGKQALPFPHDPLASIIAGRRIDRDGRSDITMDRLTRLVGRHVGLPPEGAGSRLPTRLLSIEGTGDTVRVVESQGVQGHWVALSHCWELDRAKHFNSTPENLHLRESGIAISEMPQTFQDAVIVTRKLGLKYLWIDSLCIVQGPDGDWATEAPKMGSYYGDAFITIAADSALGDLDGFLQMRHRDREARGGNIDGVSYHAAENTIYSDELDTFCYCSGEKYSRLYLQRVSWHGGVSERNPVGALPLQSRAWTLQERNLSRYILHFGPEQNYLELHEQGKTIYEDGREVYAGAYWTGLLDRDKSLPFQGWYSMIQDYAQRRVSYRSDTFPALSSLARKIGVLAGDAYRAGLWESDFARGLLWVVQGTDTTPRWANLSPTPQPSDYTAPSWSWGSVPGSVGFLLNNLHNTVDMESVLLGCGPQHAVPDEDESLMTVVKCTTTPLYSDFPEGQLTEGATLELKATRFPVQRWECIENSESSTGSVVKKWIAILLFNNNEYRLETHLDDPPEEASGFDLVAASVISLARTKGAEDVQNILFPGDTVEVGPKRIYGLVVARECGETKGQHRRLGAFRDLLWSHEQADAMAFWHAAGDAKKRSTVILI